MSVSEPVSGTMKQTEPAASAPVPGAAALPPPETPTPSAEAKPHKANPAPSGLMRGVVTALIAIILGLGVALFVILKFGSGTDKTDIARLQQEIGELRSGPDLSALTARIQALEKQSPSSASDSATATRLASVEQSLSTLGTSVSALQQSGAPGTAGPSQAALDDVKAQLAQLSGRIDALEKSVSSANAALGDRVSALEQKIPANLADQLSGAATKTAVDSLQARIATLEASTTALDAKRAAAAIALANLARAAQSGGRFGDELAAVRLLDIDPDLLAPISPFAEKGVAPASEIEARFDGAARDALRAARGAAKDWWSRFWANLTSLFLVRRTGPMPGASDEAILSRAGDDVHAGNLAGALSELSHLSAPAAGVMASWQADAKARVDLDRLVSNATGALIADLSPVPAHR